MSADRYLGRPIIGQDTEFLGGVYLGRIANVVDFAENPEPYETVYSKIDRALPADINDITALELAHVVDNVTWGAMPLSRQATVTIMKRERNARGVERLGPQHEVGLSTFIEQGGGTCHQESLLVGSMYQLLQMRRGLEGTISLEGKVGMRHTWFRHTSDSRIIIDSSERYVSELTNPVSGRNRQYLRLEEKMLGIAGLGKGLRAFANRHQAASAQ